MRAVGLRCEHREDTPCIDDPAPRLSWQLESDGVDQRQTGYHLVVEHDGHTLWDTGMVEGSASVDIPYAGRPLPARRAVHVARAGLGPGRRLSDWSEPARFRTGLAEWSASWIGRDRRHDPAVPVPGDGGEVDDDDALLGRFRRAPTSAGAFRLARRRARARRCTPPRAGLLELELNGARVGDAVLVAGLDRLPRADRVRGARRDGLLRKGENVLGAVLGDGWYAGYGRLRSRVAGATTTAASPSCCASCTSSTRTASREVVASDGHGRRRTGPLVYSDLLMGERYDARARARAVASRSR